MDKEYIHSPCVPPSIVLSDLLVVDENGFPSQGTLRRSSSLPNISDSPFEAFKLDIQTAWSPLNGRDAVVHKARLANATDRIWGQMFSNTLHGNKKDILLGIAGIRRSCQNSDSSDSSDSDYDEYEGALQLCLYPVNEGMVDGPVIANSSIGAGARALDVEPTLVSICMSTRTHGRTSAAGGVSDSSLSFGPALSSSSTSPAKRQVRFNSCVTRATFVKLPIPDEESSECGWERHVQPFDSTPSGPEPAQIEEIEEIAPAMILPPPNHKERGDTVLFSPPGHMAELNEHDLVVYERHPNGIKGIRIKRNNQRPSSSLKRTFSSANLAGPKYDFISKEEIDGLYERKDAEDVDMFGDEAGANGALNSGEIFIKGRKARRTPALGTTIVTGTNLNELQWVQVDEPHCHEEEGSMKELSGVHLKHAPTSMNDITEMLHHGGNGGAGGGLGSGSRRKNDGDTKAGGLVQMEDDETDEEDEEGGLIIHNRDEFPEAVSASPIMMLGGAIMRGWGAWM